MLGKRKKKLGNSGMSLVEIIIAIMILATIAVTVLHSLTTSMIYNSRARLRQEMTLKAESIMESFKGYSLEELSTMFSTGAGLAELTGVTSYAVTQDPDFPQRDKVQTYTITGLTDSKDNVYDVTINVISNGTEKILRMRNMDVNTDAIFNAGSDRSIDTGAHDTAWSEFTSYHVDDFASQLSGKLNKDGTPLTNTMLVGENSAEPYLELCERRLKFDVKDDGAGNYVVTATMVYRFRIKDYPYWEPISVPSPSDEYEETTPHTIPEIGFVGEEHELTYPDSDHLWEFTVMDDMIYTKPIPAAGSDDGLKRLFIYYYPQYDLSGKDHIEINNSASINGLECYIIKQRAKDISETRTESLENRYTATVDAGANINLCKLYHNLDVNIGGGSTVGGYNISGSFAGIKGFKDDAYSLDFVEEEAISYRLELTVTNASGRAVTTLNSTKLE